MCETRWKNAGKGEPEEEEEETDGYIGKEKGMDSE